MNFTNLAPVLLVAILMVLVACGMMVSHVQSWRMFRQEDLSDEEYDYRRRQYRRRMQTSAMLGILGIAMFVGDVLTIWLRSPTFTLIYWIAIVLALIWTCLLAFVDIWATKHHFGRMRDHCIIEQAKLRAEINRMQAFRGNGKGKKPLSGLNLESAPKSTPESQPESNPNAPNPEE